ncbi:sulfite exporter TauE/SafE family protein [Candidatus Woesearchaeota archaeon]|nr:sulfite exporter TauE/SafE family protein [Candidatus Woesearchaeota archaeon]
MIDLFYWFLFPVAIVIASIAMMAGIGGAIIFAPFLMLVLGFSTLEALAVSLFVEFFGFTSGIIGYLRLGTINLQVVKKLIPYTLPGAIIGVTIGRLIPESILKGILALLLIYLGYKFLYHKKEALPKHPKHTGGQKSTRKHDVTPLIKGISFLGGTLLGMISSGLGEVNEYNFLERLKMKVSAASGTSIFLVGISAVVGIIVHAFYFGSYSDAALSAGVFSVILFSIPGVIIGGQIGVGLSKKTDPVFMARYMGVLFAILGIVTLLAIF